MFVVALTDDAGVGEAALTGVACGFIVFGIAATMTLLQRRADRDRLKQADATGWAEHPDKP